MCHPKLLAQGDATPCKQRPASDQFPYASCQLGLTVGTRLDKFSSLPTPAVLLQYTHPLHPPDAPLIWDFCVAGMRGCVCFFTLILAL